MWSPYAACMLPKEHAALAFGIAIAGGSPTCGGVHRKNQRALQALRITLQKRDSLASKTSGDCDPQYYLLARRPTAHKKKYIKNQQRNSFFSLFRSGRS